MGKHYGLSDHYLYPTWNAMIQRCTNKNNSGYKDYGGRGVKVCKRWLPPTEVGFINFIKDMGDRPEGMSLDRRGNDGNYSPKNCRWATNTEQRANQRPRGLVDFSMIDEDFSLI